MAKGARERVEINETGEAMKIPGNQAVGEQRPLSHVDIGVVKLDLWVCGVGQTFVSTVKYDGDKVWRNGVSG
jgi:hypothetical protein